MTTYTYQERFKTIKGVFDEFTNRNLFELHSRDVFDELVSPLEVGKESNVFIAKKGNTKVIVKIYRVQNANFNKMYDYIRKDTRYEQLKKKPRDIIYAWTQREYRNLLQAEKAQVKAPKALGWKFNILVEELIGDIDPAPPLKDQIPQDPKHFFNLVVAEMKKLYQGKIIHGDLSAFNILNYNEQPVLIDFSQATLKKTPNSEELLERDVKNVVSFFKKLGVKTSVEEVLSRITS